MSGQVRCTPDPLGGSWRACRSLASRDQRDDPDRTARSTLDLHRQREQHGAGRRQQVEVREVLDPRDIRRGGDAVDHEVLRGPVVDRGAVHADRGDLSFLDQQARRLDAIAGEVKLRGVVRGIVAEVGLLVGPPRAPTGPHQHDVGVQPLLLKVETLLAQLGGNPARSWSSP